MKRYYVSYLTIEDGTTRISFGKGVFEPEGNFFNIEKIFGKIKNKIKEDFFTKFSKTIENLKKDDINVIILSFKELEDYEG